MKINKKKFLRNIIISIIALIIVAFIINTAPGYERDKYSGITNLVINDTNVTEQLKNEIIISKTGTIYLSLEDVKNLFDNNIYYDEAYNKIITTSELKVGSIDLEVKQMIVNGSTVNMLDAATKFNEIIYIPISEMGLIYNIEASYISETDIVIIDRLNTGLIKADVAENTDIKYKPRALSKNVEELQEGEKVNCYYTTSKGWRLIRTSKGVVGYVKANVLANELIIRQDKASLINTKNITANVEDNTNLELDGKNIIIKGLKIASQGTVDEENINKTENYDVWVNVLNQNIENKTREILEDYQTRTMLINSIVNLAMKNKIDGVIINFTQIDNTEIFNRFMIELSPKLRDVGISSIVKINENISKDNLQGVVDYVIE